MQISKNCEAKINLKKKIGFANKNKKTAKGKLSFVRKNLICKH